MQDYDESPEDLGAESMVGGDFGEEFGGGVCCERPEVDGHVVRLRVSIDRRRGWTVYYGGDISGSVS